MWRMKLGESILRVPRYQLGKENRFPRLIHSSAVIDSLRYGRNVQFGKNAVLKLSAVRIALGHRPYPHKPHIELTLIPPLGLPP